MMAPPQRKPLERPAVPPTHSHPPNTKQKSLVPRFSISVWCEQREDFVNLYVNKLRWHRQNHFCLHYYAWLLKRLLLGVIICVLSTSVSGNTLYELWIQYPHEANTGNPHKQGMVQTASHRLQWSRLTIFFSWSYIHFHVLDYAMNLKFFIESVLNY